MVYKRFLLLLLVPISYLTCSNRLLINAHSSAKILNTEFAKLYFSNKSGPEYITRIDVRPDPTFSLFPGSTLPINVDVFYENKKSKFQKSTDARKRRMRISFSDLLIDVKGGTWAEPNLIRLNNDLSGLENGQLIISVKHKKAPNVSGEWKTKIDFSLPLNYTAKGIAGRDGMSVKTLLFGGRDASEPESGSCKKCARDGFDGSDGYIGGPGHQLLVQIKKVTLKNAASPTLAISVQDLTAHTVQLFMRAPNTLLMFDVSGGTGGMGADGGSGGNGLIADVNNEPVCCDAANGGNGGQGGQGGAGGNVTFFLDPTVQKSDLNIIVHNEGGNGGIGGRAGAGGKLSGHSMQMNACVNLKEGKNGTAGAQGTSGKPGKEAIFVVKAVNVAAFDNL